MATSFVETVRRAGATVQTAAPGTTNTSSGMANAVGAFGQFQSETSSLLQGKVSLLMLDTLVLALVVFYVWTHNVQGGG